MTNTEHHHKYDLTSKDILKDLEKGLVKFVTGKEAEKVHYLDIEFQNIEAFRSDLIFEALLEDKNIIFHVEVQSDNDPTMLFRMLRYIVEIYKSNKHPVYQIVLYIGKNKLN